MFEGATSADNGGLHCMSVVPTSVRQHKVAL